jgi:hypothetical protein
MAETSDAQKIRLTHLPCDRHPLKRFVTVAGLVINTEGYILMESETRVR